MECDLKDRDKLIAGYLTGKLSEEEARNFEEHYFQCEVCFNELRAAEEAVNLIEKEGNSAFISNPETKVSKLRIADKSTHRSWGIAVAVVSVFIIILILMIPLQKKNEITNKTAVIKKDTLNNKESIRKNSISKEFTAELSGPDFKPNPYLEEMTAENTRSGSEKLDTVISPGPGQKFYDKEITFSWKMFKNEPVTLKVETNLEKEIFSRTIGHYKFPNLNTVVSPGIFKHSGLYYWRIEDENDVLYVGKFYFLK